MNLIKILMVSMLGICAIVDFKWKKINIIILVPFFFAGILCNIKYALLSPFCVLAGMGIGIIVIAIGFITKGKIGSGDGAILIVTGLFLGFYDNLMLFLMATFLVAVIGAVLLLFKRVDKNYEIPFIPILFVTFIGDLIIWS
jgi:leader peptidase (prepilin peptidase)/N-methyltransferase